METTKELKRTLSQSNAHKTNKVKEQVQKDVIFDQAKIDLPHIGNMAAYTMVLPPTEPHNRPEFTQLILDGIVDDTMESTLSERKALNWCRTIKPIHPLRTIGDGNCLLHAISLAMWGFNDSHMFLRRLLYVALLEFEARIHPRWKREKINVEKDMPNSFQAAYNSRDWDREWKMVVENASPQQSSGTQYELPYSCLEEIHVFVLANILRRPIIIIAEPVLRDIQGGTMQHNNFGGVYLPLLSKADECIKIPLVLAFDQNHFDPLVSMEDSKETEALAKPNYHAVPLVTHAQEPLKVHFLLEEQDNMKVSLDLLNLFLRPVEVPVTGHDTVMMVPATKLKPVPPPDEFNLMKDYQKDCEQRLKHNKQTPAPDTHGYNLSSSPAVPSAPFQSMSSRPQPADELPTVPTQMQHDISMVDRACQTRGCQFYTSITTFPYCHSCFDVLPPGVRAAVQSQYQSAYNASRLVGLNTKAGTTIALPPKCKIVGCNQDAHSETEFLCNVHYLQESIQFHGPVGGPAGKEGDTCHHPGCELYGLKVNGYLCSEHKKRQTPEASEVSITLCLISGCQEFGRPEIFSLCQRHYDEQRGGEAVAKSFNASAALGTLCKTLGCEMYGSTETNGYCSSCYSLHGAQENLRKQDEHPSLVENLTSMQILAKLPPTKRSELHKAKEYKNCKTAGCRKIGHEDAEGFCSDCYIKHYRDTHRARKNQDLISGDKYSPPTKTKPEKRLCQNPGCSDVTINDEIGLCSICHRASQEGRTRASLVEEQRAAEAAILQRQRVQFNENPQFFTPPPSSFYTSALPELEFTQMTCPTPGCGNVGSQANNGLCGACYNVYLRDIAKQRELVRPKPAPLVEVPTMKCREPGCEMFGRKENGYYCSTCYRKYGPVAFQAKQCRNYGCERFGDDAFNGLCSVCYDMGYNVGYDEICEPLPHNYGHSTVSEPMAPYDRSPMVTRHHSSSGRLSTGSTYDEQMMENEIKSRNGTQCATRHCHNLGNSRCNGYCNSCFQMSRVC